MVTEPHPRVSSTHSQQQNLKERPFHTSLSVCIRKHTDPVNGAASGFVTAPSVRVAPGESSSAPLFVFCAADGVMKTFSMSCSSVLRHDCMFVE